MAEHKEIPRETVEAFLSSHKEWKRSEGSPTMLARVFAFKDYPSGVAFATRIAFAAEKRHHHPNIHILWGEVRVEWWTHDTDDITDLDLEMAQVVDRIYEDGNT